MQQNHAQEDPGTFGQAREADFRFFPASPALSPFVDYLYYSQVSDRFADSVDAMRVPEVEAQLVFVIERGSQFPGGQWLSSEYRACLFLQPAHLQMIRIPGSIRQAVGISFRPAGLRLVLPRHVPDLSEHALVPLEDLWGAEAKVLLHRLIEVATPRERLRLLEQYLSARARHLSAPDGTVSHLVELIRVAHGEVSIAGLADACGYSSRTLRNATLAATGVLPKQLARIARIRRALDLLAEGGVSLRDAAASTAFSDQAHMSREFRELVGLPPARLGWQLRAQALPRFSSERKLTDTGLLVLPRIHEP